jgi:hypothetical protein
VTRSPTHAKPKTDRGVDYFFFRRFVVFFAVFFAAAFVFLFFAIAALLAMSGWRHRCSAVANRSALQSDYYSRKKITVTPHNFVRKCPAPSFRVTRAVLADKTLRGKNFRPYDRASTIDDDIEVPMDSGFLQYFIW